MKYFGFSLKHPLKNRVKGAALSFPWKLNEVALFCCLYLVFSHNPTHNLSAFGQSPRARAQVLSAYLTAPPPINPFYSAPFCN